MDQSEKNQSISASVTVIVPFLNRGGYFYRLLHSIEQQTVLPEKIFIIDNGSSLDEISLIWQYIRKSSLDITLVSSCIQRNANSARNLGLSLAETSYVAFIDSDDWWVENHIQDSIAALENCDAKGVYSSGIVHNKQGVKERKTTDINLLDSPFEIYFSKNKYLTPTCSFVVRKALSKDTEIYWDESLERHQDYDYFLNVHFKSEGWIYLKGARSHIDWQEARVVSYKKITRFLEKWERKIPIKLLENYYYKQAARAHRARDVETYNYFRDRYSKNFLKGILISKLFMTLRVSLSDVYEKFIVEPRNS